MIIRRLLLAKGIKVAGLGIVWPLTILYHTLSCQTSAVMLFEGPNRTLSTNTTSQMRDSLHHQKSMYVRACFQSTINRKTAPKASRNMKNSMTSIKNNLCEKLAFAILSLWKPNLEPQASKDQLRNEWKSIAWKQARNKMKFQACEIKKSNTQAPQSPQILIRSCKLPPPVHLTAPMVLQGGSEVHVPKWLPWCIRSTKMVLRVPKWRHPAPQIASARS